jgi:hypothetical protein
MPKLLSRFDDIREVTTRMIGADGDRDDMFTAMERMVDGDWVDGAASATKTRLINWRNA